MIIDLLRHGEAAGGARFRGAGTDAPTSPAAPAGQRDVVPQLDQRLREIHFGDWEGQTPAAVQAATPRHLQNYWDDPAAHSPFGGESLAAFRQRVLETWEDITVSPQQNHCLVATHGGVIRLLLSQVLAIPPEALPRLETPHAGLSRVRLTALPDGRRIASLAFLTAPRFLTIFPWAGTASVPDARELGRSALYYPLVGLLLGALLLALYRGLSGTVPLLAAAALVFAFMRQGIVRRLGGTTGDTTGALIEGVEAGGLVVVTLGF